MNLERLLLGAALNIVREGTLVDVDGTPTPASATVKPTAASGLWDSLGKTVSVIPRDERSTDPETVFCPDSNAWETVQNERVTADYLDVVLRDHNEIIFELLFGIDGPIPTDGSPVVPYANNNRLIKAWLQPQVRNADTGQNVAVMDLWVEMSLRNYPGWTENSAKPEVSFQILTSPLNTQVFQTIG